MNNRILKIEISLVVIGIMNGKIYIRIPKEDKTSCLVSTRGNDIHNIDFFILEVKLKELLLKYILPIFVFKRKMIFEWLFFINIWEL